MSKNKETISGSDSQNVVVDGNFYDASIVPRTKEEMWRRVSLRSDAHVGGSIFSGNLEVHGGPCTVDRSVFAGQDISVKLDAGSGRSVIRGCVQAKRSMAVRIERAEADDRLVIVGDIYAETVNLRRCVIYGNIYCGTGLLEECVVAGTVYGWTRLQLSDVVVGLFLGRSVETRSHCRLLHPLSASENEPIIDGTLDFLILPKNGESSNASPSVLTLSLSDSAHNLPSALQTDGHDGIQPRYIMGLGSRILDAREITDPLLSSANRMAEVFANTLSPEPYEAESPLWEQELMALVTAEIPEYAVGYAALHDVTLPNDADLRLLEEMGNDATTWSDSVPEASSEE